jgi:hypothetical protein
VTPPNTPGQGWIGAVDGECAIVGLDHDDAASMTRNANQFLKGSDGVTQMLEYALDTTGIEAAIGEGQVVSVTLHEGSG